MSAQPVKPKTGEQTGAQAGTSSSLAAATRQAIGEVYGSSFDLKGYSSPPPGTYETYRRMRSNPTIALARVVATIPIRTADVGFEPKDGVDDSVLAFVQDVMEPLWPTLVKNLIYALDYGHAAFEKVWEVREGRLVYGKLKPLLPDMTELMVTEANGKFAGLRQKDVLLPPSKSFVYTYDGEAGDLHGRSRDENVRPVWWQWEQAIAKEGQYVTKVAGVIPQIEYPEGKSLDRNGAEKDNFELAQAVLNQLGRGNGVAMPNTLAKYAQDLVRQGVDISKLKSWIISFLEVTGAHGTEINGILRHKESLMMRGWLVPERAAIEGQHGTLAESGEHGDVAVAVAAAILEDILLAVNRYLINPLLVVNFGPRAKHAVTMTSAGISSDQKAFIRQVVSGVITQPGNVDLFLRLLDYDALLDQAGLPKAEEVIDEETGTVAEGQREPRPAAPATQPAPERAPIPPTAGPVQPDGDAGTQAAEMAFNGAQVAAALQTLEGVSAGNISADAAVLVLQRFLRMDPEVAKAMVNAQVGQAEEVQQRESGQVQADLRTQAEGILQSIRRHSRLAS